MHDHGEILELAAAAIDFDLDADERNRLADALETCSLCRRQVSAMRATATVLRRPLDIGTPGRVRDVVIGAALGRHRAVPGWRSVLAASLSILVVLGGTAVIVGTRGLGVLPPASPGTSVPVESAPADSPEPSSTALVEASVVPSPSPSTAPSPATGSLRAGDIAAMVTDGRMVIRTLPETGANSAIFKTRLYPGQRVVIVDGPVDGDGYQWYRVRLGDIEGWAAAADRDGTPWLTPVGNGRIAYVLDSGDGGAMSIHTIAGDGTTDDAVLLDEPGLIGIRDLVWSPDGRRLAFVATPADSIDGTSEIFVIDADGLNLIRLTENDVASDHPAWSPDGARIAFDEAGVAVDATDPTRIGSAVMVVEADGVGNRQLGEGTRPVWSPDGQQVAMLVTDGGDSTVWIQGVSGQGRRRVGETTVDLVAPAWSPDGLSLLVSTGGLSLIDVASGTSSTVIEEARSSTSPPAWSVTGSIAFKATGTGAPTLFETGPDGGDPRQVVANVGFEAVPVWSPDERWLLLDDENSGTPVTLVDVERGTVVEIESGDAFSRSAAWQPLLR